MCYDRYSTLLAAPQSCRVVPCQPRCQKSDIERDRDAFLISFDEERGELGSVFCRTRLARPILLFDGPMRVSGKADLRRQKAQNPLERDGRPDQPFLAVVRA